MKIGISLLIILFIAQAIDCENGSSQIGKRCSTRAAGEGPEGIYIMAHGELTCAYAGDHCAPEQETSNRGIYAWVKGELICVPQTGAAE